ncbi:hypothetical protein N7541_000951 [Penicillium brevicompactum]|uniref:Uncharacterized protein n=1 Tax=Penicillium brevicompactum TaxID=5074 RepID=A0A9W9RV91_PENBR|nr:hypothetical protein N7541_000951 [Penicillium brevicompactum]
MLSSRWDEGRSLAANGKFRQLPKKLTWEQLLEVAVATDYIHCHEVMGPFATMWIDDLFPRQESYYGNGYRRHASGSLGVKTKLAGSVTIASVFQATTVLNNLIKDAIGDLESDFDTEDMPIAADIKDFIDESRSAYLRHNMRVIEAQAWRLIKGKTPHCDSACDAMCFGLLYKKLLESKIYLQLPEKRPALSSDCDPSTPLTNISPETIGNILMEFRPTEICPRLGVPDKEAKPPQLACCNKSDPFGLQKAKSKSKSKYSRYVYHWLCDLKVPKFLPRGLQ